MAEQLVKLTGLPVSEEMKDILDRLANNEYVDIEEINNTREIKMARSNVDYSTPTIHLDNRDEMRAYILEQMNKSGSARIDEDGKVRYNGNVTKGSRLDLVIGLPASGKSSSLVDVISQEFNSKVIDNDEAKKMIPQYNNGWGASVVHAESQYISDIAFRVAIKKHENIVLPKVGSNAEKVFNSYVRYAKEHGYGVNLHYVELERNKALGRMINRFIEEGRFLDPNLTDKYSNEREGNKIEQTYEALKESEAIQGFSRWNNDVGRGEKPFLVEFSNLEGNYIEQARKGEIAHEHRNERNDESIRTGSGNGGSRRNDPQSGTSNESGQRRHNGRYDTVGGNSVNEQVLQIKVPEKTSETKVLLKLPKLNREERKELEDALFAAGARYTKETIPADKSSTGRAVTYKKWYVLKRENTDMTPFMEYIRPDQRLAEQSVSPAELPTEKSKGVDKQSAKGKIYLYIPPMGKEQFAKTVNELKQNGAKFDGKVKSWYITEKEDLNLFKQYMGNSKEKPVSKRESAIKKLHGNQKILEQQKNIQAELEPEIKQNDMIVR